MEYFFATFISQIEPLGTEKFQYKINWMNLLYKYIRELKSLGKPIIIMGDFNVIPQEIDEITSEMENDALFDKQVRSIFLRF